MSWTTASLETKKAELTAVRQALCALEVGATEREEADRKTITSLLADLAIYSAGAEEAEKMLHSTSRSQYSLQQLVELPAEQRKTEVRCASKA